MYVQKYNMTCDIGDEFAFHSINFSPALKQQSCLIFFDQVFRNLEKNRRFCDFLDILKREYNTRANSNENSIRMRHCLHRMEYVAKQMRMHYDITLPWIRISDWTKVAKRNRWVRADVSVVIMTSQSSWIKSSNWTKVTQEECAAIMRSQ